MPSNRSRGETFEHHEAGLDLLTPQPDSTVVVDSGPGVTSPVDDVPTDLLIAPVGTEDDLAHALAVRPPRRRLPRLTASLGAAVLIAGGFVGGVEVQKHAGATATVGGNAALAGAF